MSSPAEKSDMHAEITSDEVDVIYGPGKELPVDEVHHLRHESGQLLAKLYLSSKRVNRLELYRSAIRENPGLVETLKKLLQV